VTPRIRRLTMSAINFGPRLAGTATGKLRAALLVRPSLAIESAKSIHGEPGAVYERALEQHGILCKTLAYFGVETIVLDALGDDPYEAAAVEGAIAFEDGVALMRPTSMLSRRQSERMGAECASIDAPIAGEIAPPGLLDGSDVLLVGHTAFIGVGARGNTMGRRGFASIASAHGYDVVEVKMAADVSSLRSVASAVAQDTVLVSGDKIDIDAFSGFKRIVIDRGESTGAGVLCLGEHHVIADVRYRTAFATMRKAGIVVEGIDLYDFEKVGITPGMLALALKRD
jgi:dimethylargininase